jgi:hypothetical protein
MIRLLRLLYRINGDIMKKKSILLLLLLICNTLYIKAFEEKVIITDLKKTQYGTVFFNNHSENDFKLMINFMDNPICNFDKIKKIKNFFEYIEVFDRYSQEKYHKNESIISTFLEKHFQVINRKKADILNYLILISDGMYAEYFADKYTILFESYSLVFIKTLKNRDWKGIVNRLDAGNWQAFRLGVEKLGDSEFETNFKKYVFASRDEKGNRIQRE